MDCEKKFIKFNLKYKKFLFLIIVFLEYMLKKLLIQGADFFTGFKYVFADSIFAGIIGFFIDSRKISCLTAKIIHFSFDVETYRCVV